MRNKCFSWMRFFVLLFPFFYYGITWGQTSNTNPLLPKVTTGSPEAASLGKFGECPVSEYTGVPDITVPLYTIKIKDLEIPIQLSYHAGGVKVDEISSWAGVNWTLNAGGAVTRTIVGMADDDIGGIIEQYQEGHFIKRNFSLTDVNDYIFFRDVAAELKDVEPDIYYYNFAGSSGKFCFDSTGTFHPIPANNLKVIKSAFNGLTGSGGSNTQWILRDGKGNTYYFGSNDAVGSGTNGVERTYSGVIPKPADGLKLTSWYLTKVIAANNADTIFFDYTTKSEAYQQPRSISFKYLTNEASLMYDPAFVWSSYLNANTTLQNGASGTTIPIVENITSGISTLQKIRWREGEINFTDNTARQDILYNTSGLSNMLDSVNVYNKSGTIIKSYNLKYSYIGNRYYLDTVIEFNQSKLQNLKHIFSYNSRQNLPASASLTGVGSYDQDHWGYFNGANNTSYLPSNISIPPAKVGSLTANREPDTLKMQYGILNKIVYPTGGYTLFEYEANRYDPISSVGGYGPPSPIINSSSTVSGSTTTPYNRFATLTPPLSQYVSITINVHNYAHPPQKNMSWLPYLTFGSASQQLYYGDAFDNWPASGVTANSNGLYDFSFTVPNVPIYSGITYSLVVSDTCLKITNCIEIPSIMPYITAFVTYKAYAPAPPGGTIPLPIAGGLRIKQITNYDNDNNFITRKAYNYAAGKLFTYPSYIHRYQQDVAQAINESHYSSGATLPVSYVGIYGDFLEETSTSQVILGLTQNSSVGYTEVIERDVDNAGNDQGYIDNKFSYFPDSLNIYNFNLSYWTGLSILNSAVPANSFEYKRGLLLSKSIFKKNTDNTYTKIYSLNNDYNYNEYNSKNLYSRVLGLRLNRLRFVNYPSGNLNGGYMIPSLESFSSDFAYSYYNIISGWVQNTSSTETTYDQNGSNPVTKVTQTFYDNPLHMQPTRSVTLKSNGDSLVSLTNYPQDYATGTAFIDSMVARNEIAAPIENVNYLVSPSLSRSILTGRIVTYKPDGKRLPDKIRMTNSDTSIALSNFKFSNVATGLLPYNVATKGAYSPDSRYVDRALFSTYDTYSNIAEQYKVDDAHNCYVWDYNKMYPVAEVTGATQADIAYTSFEADATGNWTIGSTARDATTAITGSKSFALSSNMSKSGLTAATTYIVSYWRKSTTAFTITGTISGYPIAGETINGWTFFLHKVTGVTTITITGTGNIDEVRLYPATAQMTSYTYTPLVGMSALCDAANKITYYEYDSFNRLRLIRDQDNNILKKICYNYLGQTTACDFSSVAKSGTYTRNNCTSGVGTTVTYTVPAGTYTSATSQAEADQLAQNDVTANGQAYANANGLCNTATIPLTYLNETTTTYNLKLTNTATSAVTNYTLSNMSTTSVFNVGSINPGTYNITITPAISGVRIFYQFGSLLTNGMNAVTANNVSLTCNPCTLIHCY